MKNNVFSNQDMYSMIRRLMLRALPYGLDFVKEDEFKSKLLTLHMNARLQEPVEITYSSHTHSLSILGKGVEFACEQELKVIASHDQLFCMTDAESELLKLIRFDSDACKALNDDILEMARWLTREGYLHVERTGDFFPTDKMITTPNLFKNRH